MIISLHSLIFVQLVKTTLILKGGSTLSNDKKYRPNTSLGPLSFTFVSHRSFKFLRFQIDPLSFEFVSDKSFKFIRFQIGHLSFEFVLDRSFNSGLTEVDRNDLSRINSKLKRPI